jgi:citrate synthase
VASGSDEHYLTTAEVARRLGVKTDTVYAYVSRGLLKSVRTRGRRGSMFAQDEVEQLAVRGREERPPSGPVERIHTAITLLDGDELYYRGHRAVDLSLSATFESVVHLLWTGELNDQPPFPLHPELTGLVDAALKAMPPEAGLLDRLKVAAAFLGSTDPLRFDLSPSAVMRVGRSLISMLVDALPGPPGEGERIAGRLRTKLTTKPIEATMINAVLVLLADHDLAASTVAVRVAASARAHPYSVVSAGLGAIDGQCHGGASLLAYRFLRDAMEDPFGALSERLRSGGGLPGFGHHGYQKRDPRADVLLAFLRARPAGEQVMATVDAVTLGAGSFPNVDLALAAFTHAFQMRPDAGEALFALARCAGWIGHAIEEYREPGLRFRPLGVYIGDRPGR